MKNVPWKEVLMWGVIWIPFPVLTIWAFATRFGKRCDLIQERLTSWEAWWQAIVLVVVLTVATWIYVWIIATKTEGRRRDENSRQG